MRMKQLTWWVLVWVLGALPALAQTQPVRLAAAVRPATKGFVWTIERAGQTGWLVGSLHLMTPDAYPLPPFLESAFLSAQVLVEEADPDELKAPEAAAELVRRAFYPAGQSLEKHLSADTYRTIVERASKVGLPAEAVQRMRPWMLAITLAAVEMQSAGFDPALGLDRHFRDRAIGMGKPLQTLEASLEQVSILESLGAALQESLVVETLKGTETEISQIRTLMAAWKGGDAAGLERILLDGTKESPQIYQALFVDRNKRWVPKIEACLAKARCMVVVGAGHMVGPDGLIDLLSKRGYTVSQR
jgi:uncharacterized protein